MLALLTPKMLRRLAVAGLLALLALGLVVTYRAVVARGYTRAETLYLARITAMEEANRRAVEDAQAELATRTAHLTRELADNEARLKEILDDTSADYDAGCGAPVRALRLLDQIR